MNGFLLNRMNRKTKKGVAAGGLSIIPVGSGSGLTVSHPNAEYIFHRKLKKKNV
jgi:hypothetical protein